MKANLLDPTYRAENIPWKKRVYRERNFVICNVIIISLVISRAELKSVERLDESRVEICRAIRWKLPYYSYNCYKLDQSKCWRKYKLITKYIKEMITLDDMMRDELNRLPSEKKWSFSTWCMLNLMEFDWLSTMLRNKFVSTVLRWDLSTIRQLRMVSNIVMSNNLILGNKSIGWHLYLFKKTRTL